MKPLVHLTELLVGNVRVDLRRRDGRMTEHSLDRADVGAIAQ